MDRSVISLATSLPFDPALAAAGRQHTESQSVSYTFLFPIGTGTDCISNSTAIYNGRLRMFRGNVGTLVLMTVCFIVAVLFIQTIMAPFAAIGDLIGEKPPDHLSWGNTHLANKEYDKAIAEYTEAIKLDPADARAYERLAWVLATAAKDELRDGKKAVEYAKKACELTDWKNPDYLATLSAAFAETGDFKEAIKWQMKALEAPELEPEKAEQYRHRLKMFEEGKPFRE